MWQLPVVDGVDGAMEPKVAPLLSLSRCGRKSSSRALRFAHGTLLARMGDAVAVSGACEWGQPWDFLSFGSSCFAALLSDVREGEEEERGKISKCMALVS